MNASAIHRGMFLDRDGVLNEVRSNRVKYVNKPDDLYLLEGVPDAIRTFNQLGFKVFVVTNQGGIGLGYMSEAALEAIHETMIDALAQSGAYIDDIAVCPHKPHAGCPCRKPKPKMVADLAKRHDIDLSASWMAGDREVDIETGKVAGTKTVLIGGRSVQTHIDADLAFMSLAKAADWFAAHGRNNAQTTGIQHL